MSFAVTAENGIPAMSFQSGDDLLTNVILSIEIEQGTFFADPSFGLKRRKRQKRGDAAAALVKGDFQQALQWLLDVGRATAIEINVELDPDNNDRLQVESLVTGTKGNQVRYEKFVEVV